MLASLQMLEMGKIYTVTLMMGINNVSRGEARKMMRLQDKVSRIPQELRFYLEPTILTICTVPYNMMVDQNAREIIERVRNNKEISRQIQQRCVLPMRVLDVARMMEDSLPQDASSDDIHFDRPGGTEWLKGVFQRHINFLESDLLERGQFTFGSPPISPFFLARSATDRVRGRIESRGSSTSSRSRQLRSKPMEGDEEESSTPQSSVVLSGVVVDSKKKVEGPGEASRTRYLERVKDLDLEDLACRQELTESWGTSRLSREDLSNHYCVDWLKAHDAHFS